MCEWVTDIGPGLDIHINVIVLQGHANIEASDSQVLLRFGKLFSASGEGAKAGLLVKNIWK